MPAVVTRYRLGLLLSGDNSRAKSHMLRDPRVHRNRSGSGRINAAGRAKLTDFDDRVCRCNRRFRQPRALLAKEQHASCGKIKGLDDDRARNVIDGDHRQRGIRGPLRKRLNRVVVQYMLVAIGHHRSTFVPAASTNDVHRVRSERVGTSHDGPDIHVVLPILDCHMKRMPLSIQIGDDRRHVPVAIAINDVSTVTSGQELGVKMLVGGQLSRPRANTIGCELNAWCRGGDRTGQSGIKVEGSH